MACLALEWHNEHIEDQITPFTTGNLIVYEFNTNIKHDILLSLELCSFRAPLCMWLSYVGRSEVEEVHGIIYTYQYGRFATTVYNTAHAICTEDRQKVK